MGTRIIMPGADFENSAIGFLPFVSTGLLGWWFLNGSIGKARRNLLLGGADASVVGNPTITENYMSFLSGSNYLLTDVRETENLTILCVARSTASFVDNPNRPHLVSNYLASNSGAYIAVGGSPSGAPSASISSATFRDISGTINSGGSTVNVADFTKWKFLAGVHTSAQSAMYSLTDNFEDIDPKGGTRILKPNVPFRIGSSEGTQFRGSSDIAFVAIYNRALQKNELETLYAQVQAYLGPKGITI